MVPTFLTHHSVSRRIRIVISTVSLTALCFTSLLTGMDASISVSPQIPYRRSIAAPVLGDYATTIGSVTESYKASGSYTAAGSKESRLFALYDATPLASIGRGSSFIAGSAGDTLFGTGEGAYNLGSSTAKLLLQNDTVNSATPAYAHRHQSLVVRQNLVSGLFLVAVGEYGQTEYRIIPALEGDRDATKDSIILSLIDKVLAAAGRHELSPIHTKTEFEPTYGHVGIGWQGELTTNASILPDVSFAITTGYVLLTPRESHTIPLPDFMPYNRTNGIYVQARVDGHILPRIAFSLSGATTIYLKRNLLLPLAVGTLVDGSPVWNNGLLNLTRTLGVFNPGTLWVCSGSLRGELGLGASIEVGTHFAYQEKTRVTSLAALPFEGITREAWDAASNLYEPYGHWRHQGVFAAFVLERPAAPHIRWLPQLSIGYYIPFRGVRSFTPTVLSGTLELGIEWRF